MINDKNETRSGLPENWAQMTPEEKRQYRLEKYMNTDGIQFISPDAEHMYKIRARRMVDVLNVQEPDRVPINLPVEDLPLRLQGLNFHTAMYDPEKAYQAVMKFNEQYCNELEYFAGLRTASGRALEFLDYRIYAWPGHGISDDASGWQYIEGEYMTAEEYDDLIRDPSDFWLRTYLPRVSGAFEGFKMFQPFTNISENVHISQLMPLGTPQVQDMLQRLMNAGKAFQETGRIMKKYAGMGTAHGFPVMGMSFCKAPFDILGDTLRGTRNIMMDMFRRPETLLQAMDVIADNMIHTILTSPNILKTCVVSYPLHKGADGWMSKEKFDTFYWPPLKKMMDAFIKEGLIQRMFAEGSYNTRLEYINEFPKGTVTWHFDQTDMVKAKEILGGQCCLQGNVPISLLLTGRAEEVKDCCRKLIETCGKGGGYILAPGAMASGVPLENIWAMSDAVKEYGVYRT